MTKKVSEDSLQKGICTCTIDITGALQLINRKSDGIKVPYFPAPRTEAPRDYYVIKYEDVHIDEDTK